VKLKIIHTPEKKPYEVPTNKFRRFHNKLDESKIKIMFLVNEITLIAEYKIGYIGEGMEVVPKSLLDKAKIYMEYQKCTKGFLYNCIVHSQYVEFKMV